MWRGEGISVTEEWLCGFQINLFHVSGRKMNSINKFGYFFAGLSWPRYEN